MSLEERMEVNEINKMGIGQEWHNRSLKEHKSFTSREIVSRGIPQKVKYFKYIIKKQYTKWQTWIHDGFHLPSHAEQLNF